MAATTAAPAARVRRPSGAVSTMSSWPCSSAPQSIRTITRTARNESASGTIRLSISASMYASTLVIARMLNASLRRSG
jgi:hypothetical protein